MTAKTSRTGTIDMLSSLSRPRYPNAALGIEKNNLSAVALQGGRNGFEIRQAGCSACLGMNEDKVPAGEYCISTSNRNFEGRQGAGARTLLASPLTAAAAAITGTVTDVRELLS